MSLKKPSYLFAGICLAIVLYACREKKSVAPDTPIETEITSNFYFKASIDGETVLIQDGVEGYGSGADELGGCAPKGWEEDQGMVITRFLNPKNSVGIYLIKNFEDSPTDCSEIESMFHSGVYNFGKMSDGAEIGTDGVVITYMDNNGTVWTSYNGEGSQSGSTFKVTEHTTNPDSSSQKITKAIFSCMLYDEDGNSKPLRNGEIRCRSVQCNGL